jgi:cell division protein FtsL
MKKKTNGKKENGKISITAFISVVLIFFVISVFLYLFNIKMIKNATKEKTKLINEIKVLQSEIDDLTIEKQKLLAHDRIEKIAKEKLGLVPNLSVSEKIFVNKKELEYIKRIIDGKYE